MRGSGQDKSPKSKQETDRIQVYVRIRPRNAGELDREEANGIDVDLNQTQLKLLDGKGKRYTFDKIFTPETHSSDQVFQVVGRPLVDAAFAGFNGTLLAYGQTGTGKTYTLMANDGIAQLTTAKLFRRIHQDNYHEYKVSMSYIQIYQEKIFDLLNANPRVELMLRENPRKGIYVENLTALTVHCPSEVAALLRIGRKRLIFSETRMNRISSRSHSVCQITVERFLNRGAPQDTRDSIPSSVNSSPPSVSRPLLQGLPVTSFAGSLDRLTQNARALSRNQSSRGSRFNPAITSTPNLTESAGSPNQRREKRRSIDLTSLPRLSDLPISSSNRWSVGEFSCNLPGQTSNDWTLGCEDSMMFYDMASSNDSSDSFRGPSSPHVSTHGFDDDEDERTFLEGIRITEDVVIKGRLNICDLAGSERIKRSGVQGEHLLELQHINLSLLELGNTIHALADGNKRSHIPFRNSTLTRLLQDSFGGNCKTGFVLCVSPSFRDLSETRSTLDFGQRALKITSTAHVNVEVDYAKLSEDLRRKLEAQDLEIKSQKDTFERKNLALKSEAEMKLAEAEALLEAERKQSKMETHLLKVEQEKLRQALAEMECRNELLKMARGRKLTMENNDPFVDKESGNEVTRGIEGNGAPRSGHKGRSLEGHRDEGTFQTEVLSGEMEKLQLSLELERNRILDLENRLKTSLLTEQEKARELNETNVDRSQNLPLANSQSETLFNVFLAEIMSLQLLYQIEGLSRALHVGAPRSCDSGCSDYAAINLLESVNTTLIEKGELILNSLRDKQRRESRVSLTSTDSFRELCCLQFPRSSSPKVSLEELQKIERFHSTSLGSIQEIKSELQVDSRKTFSSNDVLMQGLQDPRKSSSVDADFWLASLDSDISPHDMVAEDTANAFSSDAVLMASSDSKKQLSTGRILDSNSNSSLESFCEGEPLSPRHHTRPGDSGCGSQHSDLEQHSKVSGLLNQEQNCVVPLAEEEDGNIDSDEILECDNYDEEQIQSLKERVQCLGKDLLQLKLDLDGEMINFFSDAFGLDMPMDNTRADFSSEMKMLLEEVTERLLTGPDTGASTAGGEPQNEGLDPVLLEEALNLLLVNKTVMSCVLIFQSRGLHVQRREQATENPVIHSKPKIDKQIQVDFQPTFGQKKGRRIRKEAAVGTDPVVRPSMRNQDSQTSREEISLRTPNVSYSTEDTPETVIPAPMDAWTCRFQTNMEEFDSDPLSNDHERLAVAPPRGGCSEENRTANTVLSADSNSSNRNPSDDVDGNARRGGKKKRARLSCLGFARWSSRRSSQRKRASTNYFKSLGH